MKNKEIIDIKDKAEFLSAGPEALIALLPTPGINQLFIKKYILTYLVWAIGHNEFIHISGSSGTAKTSLMLSLKPESQNFTLLCKYLNMPVKPLWLYEVEVVVFDTPGEVFQRRSLREGNTYDEQSQLVSALKDSVTRSEEWYPCVYLRELGRVHNASTQSGFLNLLTHNDITLPDNSKIPGGHFSLVADSNYQSMDDAHYQLITLDEALKRRFTYNLTMEYLPPVMEQKVLEYLIRNAENKEPDISLIKKILTIGTKIRKYKSEGSLPSVAFPTIYGYLATYRLATSPIGGYFELALLNTFLGNSSREDRKLLESIIQTTYYDDIHRSSQHTFTDDAV